MADQVQDAARVNEKVLVRRIAEGDDTALDALYKANSDAVFRFAHRRLGSSIEDAEEVTVDTFLSAVQLAPTYVASCSARTWLCGIARLRVIDLLRKQGRDKRVPEDALVTLGEAELLELRQLKVTRSPLHEVIQQLDLELLVRAMAARLLEDERDALMMHYADGLSHQDISHVLGRTVKGVKNLIARGKQKLRQTFEEWME